MIHDSELLDKLSVLEIESFSGEVFRATRKSLDPLAPSTNGGRWMPRGENSVLYTSLSRDGALAELSFHWGMLTPLPSKPAVLSRIKVEMKSSMRLLHADLKKFGINETEYQQLNYDKMQKIGAAVAFLDCHGLIVPSARWSCENLIIFTDNLHESEDLVVAEVEEVNWQQWGKENQLI